MTWQTTECLESWMRTNMKITKKQLRRIIKEEKSRLNEVGSVTAIDNLNEAMDAYVESSIENYLRSGGTKDMALRMAVMTLREEVDGYIKFTLDED